MSISFGHVAGVHSNVAALEVSEHWDDLNLANLLMPEEERSPKKISLPSGMMNVVIGEDDGTPRTKNPDGSPVKVTKEVLTHRHKKKWEKSNHSVLKDRYGAVPHKPPCMVQSSLERLANPLMGRYKSKEEYEGRVNTAPRANNTSSGGATASNSRSGRGIGGGATNTGTRNYNTRRSNVTKEAFFTGDDDAELSPQKEGFFLTATEDANSPQRGRGTRGSRGAGNNYTHTGSSSRGPTGRGRGSSRGPAAVAAARDPLVGGAGRVNTLRSRVEAAGRKNQATQGANRLRSTTTTRVNKLQQSVLDARKKAKAASKKRGNTPAATGRSAIRGDIKSSGYGSSAGFSRPTRKPAAGSSGGGGGAGGLNTSIRGRAGGAGSGAGAKNDDDTSTRGRDHRVGVTNKNGNPSSGRFGGSARSRGASRGASTTRRGGEKSSSSRGSSRGRELSAGQTNAEKAAARRAAAPGGSRRV